MGKKPTKTASWRTLMRRAETAAPAEAKRLRDRAAAMRRDERNAAAAPKRAVAKRVKASNELTRKATRKPKKVPASVLKKLNVKQAQRDANELMGSMLSKVEARHFGANEALPSGMTSEMAAASREERRNQEKAEQLAVHVRAIMTDARKRKGGEGEKAIEARIRNMIGIAVNEANMLSIRESQAAFRRMARANTAQIVRGFLAQVENAEQHYRQGIPVMSLSANTIAKIVDALNAAGWSSRDTPDGFLDV